jgi:hypothetical protein
MNKTMIIAVPVALLLAGCATTGPVTAEERARCAQMASAMGTDPQHDHAEVKGVQARSPMNRTHDRCREILRQDHGPDSRGGE